MPWHLFHAYIEMLIYVANSKLVVLLVQHTNAQLHD
jgi:hypothetical protein